MGRLELAQNGFEVAELILGDSWEVCKGLLGTMEETLSSKCIFGDAGELFDGLRVVFWGQNPLVLVTVISVWLHECDVSAQRQFCGVQMKLLMVQ